MPAKPAYPGVYLEEVPTRERTIAGVATSIAAFIGSTRQGGFDKPGRIRSFAEFERAFGVVAPNLETGYAVRHYFANGGTEAWVVRVAQRATQAQIKKALKALDTVELFNLLVLPGATAPAVVGAAADYCRQRRAFLLVDAPASARSPEQMLQAMQTLSIEASSHAAIFYPWVRLADPLNSGQTRLAPPSGAIAGLIARIDAASGVWKSPAGRGATLKGVKGLDYNPSDAEIGLLASLGVNCLRMLPGIGTVSWGARTFAGKSGVGSPGTELEFAL